MPRKRHPHLQRARDMRNFPTEAEYKLWGALRSRQLGGIKFRRQATIGIYIVDFVTFEKMLIVEADGEQHAEQREYDDRRTKWLESQGFQVVRFWNAHVMNEFEWVVEKIAKKLGL